MLRQRVLDPAEEVIFRAQLETPAPTESIGDITYSLWKGAKLLTPTAPAFSRSFIVGLPVLCLAFLAFGGWVAREAQKGNDLPVRIFGIGLMFAIYLGPLAALLSMKLQRRNPKEVEKEAERPPVIVPPHSIAAYVLIAQRGTSIGWLWIEHDELCFQGVGFDFRLKRNDFRKKGSLSKALTGGQILWLQHPRGTSSYGISVTPGEIRESIFHGNRKLWKNLAAELKTWDLAPASPEPSLYPPIRAIKRSRPRLTLSTWLGPPVFMTLLLGAVPLLLPLSPETPAARSPLMLAGTGFLLGLSWPLMLYLDFVLARSTDREVEKAIRRARNKSIQ